MVLMFAPFDVVVVPTTTMLLFYFAIMGLAAGIVFMFLIYLHLRVFRMGPLGKAELGNKRGFIAIVRDLNGKTDVKKLNPSSKAIMDAKNGDESYLVSQGTPCLVNQGPTVFLIEARSGAAASPEVIKISKALQSDKIPDINAKDGKSLILEFAQKFYYPNYLFQWPIRVYNLKNGGTAQLHAGATDDQRAKLKADEPEVYESWKRDSMADQKAFIGFDIEKKNELSFMNEIRTGVKRSVLQLKGYEEDPATVVVKPKLETDIPAEVIDRITEHDWLSKMAKIGAQWPGWVRYVDGEALDVSAVFRWMATGPSPTDIKARDNWLWQKWQTTASKGKTSNMLAFLMILMALAMGGLIGYLVHGG
jgi:hypothetical protein